MRFPALTVALLFASRLAAQAPPPPATDSAPLAVYLITIGQGDPYWTSFGHNALWIVDREQRTSVAYNWGLFDFNEPGFLKRFLSGNTRYWMAGFDAASMMNVYRGENRHLDVQELELSADQARALRDFVEWNSLPENRAYRYQYYLDNCSTRIRDALDRVLGGQLRAATDTIATSDTYRSHTRRLLSGHAGTYFGIQLVLGRDADRPISAWDEMFIPMEMRDHLRRVTVTGPGGARAQLVKREWREFQATRAPETARPPNRIPLFAAISLAIGALIASLAYFRRAPATLKALIFAWSLFAGVVGAVAAGMWAFTQHTFMYRNETVLQFNILSLVLAVLVASGRRSVVGGRRNPTFVVAVTIAALSTIGLLLKALPIFTQANGEMIALALPAHLAVAYAAWRLTSDE